MSVRPCRSTLQFFEKGSTSKTYFIVLFGVCSYISVTRGCKLCALQYSCAAVQCKVITVAEPALLPRSTVTSDYGLHTVIRCALAKMSCNVRFDSRGAADWSTPQPEAAATSFTLISRLAITPGSLIYLTTNFCIQPVDTCTMRRTMVC